MRLVYVGVVVLTAVVFIGLSVLGADETTVCLALLIPLFVGPYMASSVTMHFGSSRERRR
jgi:hypothetical protein